MHTGSGGMSVDQMTRGAAIACDVARAANSERKGHAQPHASAAVKAIDTIDIGGGLPVTWGDAPQSPTFAEYAEALRKNVPALFNGEFSRV